MASFHRQLLAAARPVWDRILGHPFLAAVADGSIDDETFRTWMAQDYLYVQGMVPFMGALVARAPVDQRAFLIEATQALLRELELFREQAEAHGVVLEGVEPAPTCHAYLNFMLATACTRPYPCGFTVLYALEKAYLDSWLWVKAHQEGPSPWQAFIDNWTHPAFQGYVEELARILDGLAAEASEDQRREMEALFRLTARYEYLFWEMAYRREGWPV